MISATVLAVIAITFFIIYYFSKPTVNLPPGPKGLPIIGNALQMRGKLHKVMENWTKQYGDIVSLRILTARFVVLSDPKLVKEVFSNESAFTGKMDAAVLDLFEDGVAHGVINTEGEHWEQLRRFTLRQLRDFGFGKASMESCIMDEVNELHEHFRSQDGKPFSGLKDKLTLAVLNGLWTIVSGKRYNQNDPKLSRLSRSLDEAMRSLAEGGGAAIVFVPWLRHIIPKLSGYTNFRTVMKEFREFFTEAAEEHKKDYDDNFARDFMDVFIKQIKETDDPNSAFYKEVGEKQLVATIADLFSAGSGTTSTTLAWTALYLATFPTVQEKLQEEIRAITGNTRPCSLTDRPNMPYAEAVLAEVLRYSSMVQGGAPHRAETDRVIQGYTIPKDTLVIPAFYYIHHNPKIWGDPENFRPERFLSPDGKKFVRNEALMPFSIGRRQCLGESLARDTLFLFMNNTYQKFNIRFNPSKPKPELEPLPGFVLIPEDFDVIMEYRLD